ncbi:hypothetical protein V8G54_008544 [Vigna mungo]|uniref:Pentatricopeptide repeat-containing protein n=1 Tax=Vigna mungo TaxID=3915 RepID=A0AAQ3P5T3_VIGMU
MTLAPGDQTNLDPHRLANPTTQTLHDVHSSAPTNKTPPAPSDRETTPYRTPDDDSAVALHRPPLALHHYYSPADQMLLLLLPLLLLQFPNPNPNDSLFEAMRPLKLPISEKTPPPSKEGLLAVANSFDSRTLSRNKALLDKVFDVGADIASVTVRVELSLLEWEFDRRRRGRGCRSDLRGRGRIVVVVAAAIVGVVGGGFWFVGAFRLAATTADGDIAKDAAFGPVAAAVLAEMAWLGEVVVVVVAELGVDGWWWWWCCLSLRSPPQMECISCISGQKRKKEERKKEEIVSLGVSESVLCFGRSVSLLKKEKKRKKESLGLTNIPAEHCTAQKNASYNVVISGLARFGRVRDVQRLLEEMSHLNVVSYNVMVDAYARVEAMPQRNAISWTVIINGLYEEAHKVFGRMPQKNNVARTTMITGFCKGKMEEA